VYPIGLSFSSSPPPGVFILLFCPIHKSDTAGELRSERFLDKA
jgi:hypothetical protein